MYCKRCGTPLHTGVVICPECGARQRRQASSVRCASCHGRVPLTLSVCPRCGRDVRPAGPRWGVWLAVAIGLVLVVLWSLGKMPIERAGQEIADIKSKVSGLVQVLGPAPTNTKTTATPQLLAMTTPAAPPTTTAEDELPVSTPEAELSVDAGEGESPTAEPSPAETGLNTGVETPATGQQTATAASTPTSTATPTLPPSPTATAVPPTATVPPPTATATPAAGNNANNVSYSVGRYAIRDRAALRCEPGGAACRQSHHRQHDAAHRSGAGDSGRRCSARADRHAQAASDAYTGETGVAAHAGALSARTGPDRTRRSGIVPRRHGADLPDLGCGAGHDG